MSVSQTGIDHVIQVGLLAWEALTGQQLAGPSVSKGALEQMASGEAPYPWEHLPLPQKFDESRLKAVVLECLRRKPSQRPSAAALKLAVDALGHRTLTQATGNADAASLAAARADPHTC